MKKISLIISTFFIAISAFAQIDEVKLIVSGTASTKEKATSIALRSAIEQAFGTFVSANTEIVNDNLIKDEIVTISSGNIRQYKELSSILLPNHQYSITLEAVVSIKKLTKFAKAHGSSCELAGNVFAENMKLKALYKLNEETALKHLERQLRILEDNHLFDISITTGEPTLHKNSIWDDKYSNETYYRVPIHLSLRGTKNSDAYLKLFFSTLNSLKLSKDEIEYYKLHNIPKFERKVHTFGDYRIVEREQVTYPRDNNSRASNNSRSYYNNSRASNNSRSYNTNSNTANGRTSPYTAGITYTYTQKPKTTIVHDTIYEDGKIIYSEFFRSDNFFPVLRPYKQLENIFIRFNGLTNNETTTSALNETVFMGTYRGFLTKQKLDELWRLGINEYDDYALYDLFGDYYTIRPNIRSTYKKDSKDIGFNLPILSILNAIYTTGSEHPELRYRGGDISQKVGPRVKFSFDEIYSYYQYIYRMPSKDEDDYYIRYNNTICTNLIKCEHGWNSSYTTIYYNNLSAYTATENNALPKKKSKKNMEETKNYQEIASITFYVLFTEKEISKLTGFEIMYR
jgi:hypothetical protein